jgi:hypothetical protein
VVCYGGRLGTLPEPFVKDGPAGLLAFAVYCAHAGHDEIYRVGFYRFYI